MAMVLSTASSVTETNPRDDDGIEDGAEDEDLDGIDNIDEDNFATDIDDNDTDNDGVEDGDEDKNRDGEETRTTSPTAPMSTPQE
jgi:hypothetical protein